MPINNTQRLSDLDRISRLYDFYGPLLPEKQRRAIELHYLEDLSFSEIAAEEKISRQAVYDALRHGLSALNEYETKLGLVQKLDKLTTDYHQTLNSILGMVNQVNPNEINEKLISNLKANLKKAMEDINPSELPYV